MSSKNVEDKKNQLFFSGLSSLKSTFLIHFLIARFCFGLKHIGFHQNFIFKIIKIKNQNKMSSKADQNDDNVDQIKHVQIKIKN